MNYIEEQNSELEALQSIYPTELEIESADFPARFSVLVRCEDFDEDDEDCVQCSLKVKYSDTYPDSVPELALDDCSENLDESEETEKLLEKLRKVAENHLGIVMCFTLVSALQEELNAVREKFAANRLYEAERAKREQEDAERRRVEGTTVTVDSFIAWKQKFDAEMKLLRQKQGFIDVQEKNIRPTGRQQFLKDANLCTSDIRLIEESGEEVEIDESLFQDVDDLDLGDNNDLLLCSDDEDNA